LRVKIPGQEFPPSKECHSPSTDLVHLSRLGTSWGRKWGQSELLPPHLLHRCYHRFYVSPSPCSPSSTHVPPIWHLVPSLVHHAFFNFFLKPSHPTNHILYICTNLHACLIITSLSKPLILSDFVVPSTITVLYKSSYSHQNCCVYL
jgi:hypothetical protein